MEMNGCSLLTKSNFNLVPRVSLLMWRETLVGADHVTLLESLLYFDPQLGESVII